MNEFMGKAFTLLVAMSEWLREGLRYTLPQRVGKIGFKPTRTVLQLEANGTKSNKYIIEQSWLGLERICTQVPLPTISKLEIILHPSQYHKIQLTLPNSAEKHLASAVSLQLIEASPICMSKATYQFKKIGRNKHQHILVDVILCRTSTLRTVVEDNLDDASSYNITVPSNPSSNAKYYLCKENKRTSPISSALARHAALPISIIIAISGLQAGQTKLYDAHISYEERLISSLKEKKIQLSKLEQDISSTKNRYLPENHQQLLHKIHSLLADTPDKFIIETLFAQNGIISITGYAPTDTQPLFDQEFETVQFLPSKYPNYSQVTLKVISGNLAS